MIRHKFATVMVIKEIFSSHGLPIQRVISQEGFGFSLRHFL